MTGWVRLIIIGGIAAVTLGGTTSAKRSGSEGSAMSFNMYPIGKVLKSGSSCAIEVDPKYQDGLLGLKDFSHVWVFWWFDRNDTPEKRSTLRVHPRGNRKNPLTGVFATRSPARPNLIGLTLCKIRSVDGNIVRIDKIDAFDKTPVVDLKPYIPGYDGNGKGTVPQWIKGQ